MLKKCLLIITVIIIFFAVYYPTRHARRYSYIVLENILKQLDLRNPKIIDLNLKNCSYGDLILKNEDVTKIPERVTFQKTFPGDSHHTTIVVLLRMQTNPMHAYGDLILKNEDVTKIPERVTFQKTLPGGEYKPENCAPLIKTALIIPYRNRQQHLAIFLQYMHSFLQSQKIHYRIFIVHQNDTLPFNRAKMINYGAKLAIKFMYHCLILHDVDLIPMNTGNLYGCTKLPRHMSSSLDTFRYNLPYLTLFGGAVAISSEQFQEVNGMSNHFQGWGGEDDDLFRRLVNSNLNPCRFPPQVSKYIMLPHEKETASKDRFQVLERVEDNQKDDGLNSLSNKYLVNIEDLFTHIIVS